MLGRALRELETLWDARPVADEQRVGLSDAEKVAELRLLSEAATGEAVGDSEEALLGVDHAELEGTGDCGGERVTADVALTLRG